jgi:hypothetical protein
LSDDFRLIELADNLVGDMAPLAQDGFIIGQSLSTGQIEQY